MTAARSNNEVLCKYYRQMSFGRSNICLLIVFFLASCTAQTGSVPSDTPAPNPAMQTYQLVQGWMDACNALDADTYMSYYSEELVYLNVAIKDFGIITYEDFNRSTHDDFGQEGCKIDFNAWFISLDGRYAAVEGVSHALNRQGRQVDMPVAIILEFQDGRIIRQTDYLDDSPMK